MFNAFKTGSVTALKIFGGAIVTGAGMALGKGIMVSAMDATASGLNKLSKRVKRSETVRKAEKTAAEATQNVANAAA